MGSGKRRKSSDQTLIRRPKSAVGLENEGGQGSQPDAAGTAADQCVSSFQIIVVRSPLTITNAKVELILEGNVYACYILGQRIAKLNSRRSEMISKCNSIGIRYNGLIVEAKDNTYARFRRIA